MPTEQYTCVLCNASSDDVRIEVIRWKAIPRPWTAEPRCHDRTACRNRVEAAGQAWDVEDAAA